MLLVQHSGHAQRDELSALRRQYEALARQGKYAEAGVVARRALRLAKKKFGPNHLSVGASLNNLAMLYDSQGRHAEAEPLYKRGLAIAEKVLGPGHRSVASSLNNLAALYLAQGRFAEAERLYKRSLAIRKKVFGIRHPDVGISLNNLASLYWSWGRYSRAARSLEQSLSILKKSLGLRHPVVASTLNNLAGVYKSQGRFSKAERLFKRSLAIRKKVLGIWHPDVGSSFNNLGDLNFAQGRYRDAERHYKRSLVIREKALGPDHYGVSDVLNNLAVLYETQGLVAQAEAFYKRSLAIAEKVFGPDHPSVATTLGNLAVLYRVQGRAAEAEKLFKRSLAIDESVLGRNHPSVANTLSNLANLYTNQVRPAEAERLYRRSLSIQEKALGPDHPGVALTLNNLALLYDYQGRDVEAEPLYQRSLAIHEKALGPDHPEVANTLNNLAGLYRVQGRYVEAVHYYRRGTSATTRRMLRGTSIVGRKLTQIMETEAARSSFAFSKFVKTAHRLAGQQPQSHDMLAREMFKIAQWASSSVAAASLAKMAARQATGDGDLARLVRERQDLVAEWQKRDALRSTAVAQPSAKRNKKQETENVARLADIDRRILIIDKRLATDFPDYTALANPEPLTISQVQDQLKGNEALVLFLDAPKSKPTPEETFVWVVTKTASRWVRSNLGPKALKDHVDALRCGLDAEGAWKGTRCFDLLNVVYSDQDQRVGKPLPFELGRAHQLYKSLFGQVENLIKGKNLLIVPSGPLTQLPFQVLVTEKPETEQLTRAAFIEASWLARHHEITVLPSVSSLRALRAHAKISRARKPFVGFGNPLLDGDTQDRWQRAAAEQARAIQGCATSMPVRTAQLRIARQAIMPMGRGARLADLSQIRSAAALPETADEVCAAGRMAGASKDDIYLGERATEAGLKALSERGALARYKVIHFATHGALTGELKGSNEPGLIFSPPKMATKKDDGYLSASEVAGLKLDADWVILSACNTAGGGANSAEALSGLAKAFFYAGARSLLVSHWYVDSQATVALITQAFEAQERNPQIGRAGALRHAMLSLITSGERTWHPAYWAPFAIVGEGGAAPDQAGAAQSVDQVPPLPRQQKSRARTATVVPRTAVAKSVKKRRKRPKVIRRKRSRKQTSPPAPNWAEQYFQK